MAFAIVLFGWFIVDGLIESRWSASIRAALLVASCLLLIPAQGSRANVASVLAGRPVAVTHAARLAVRLPDPIGPTRARAVIWATLVILLAVSGVA